MPQELDIKQPLRVLLITDVFPPGSGGSGWSTYYLGKALKERGHQVRVMRPRYGAPVSHAARRVVEYEGLMVEDIMVPSAPGWAAKLGIGKALEEREASRALARRASNLAIRSGANLLHGQHAVSIVAASVAARHARQKGAQVVSLGTVRDYWPLCSVSTRLFTDAQGRLFECQDCHKYRDYINCVLAKNQKSKIQNPKLLDPRPTARWLQTLSASRALAKCDAVIAVSEYVRGELARSARVPKDKLMTVPNLVDLPSVDRALAGTWPLSDISPAEQFLLFAGKLDSNKGAQMLPDLIEKSGVRLPLVLAGDGPLRSSIERDAKGRGLDFRFYDWLDNDSVLLLMHHARALLFPSAWQEPLSRVLLEGCSAGAAIVALDTGGTADIVSHCESGWLAQNQDQFVKGVGQVTTDTKLADKLREGARSRAEEAYSAPIVSAKVEVLYVKLLDGAAPS